MSEKLRKILVGAVIASLGAVATYAVEAIPSLNIPAALVPVVTAGLSVLVNVLRKNANLFINLPQPGPTPVPGPVPVDPVPAPVPTPGPAPTPLEALIEGLLRIASEKLKSGDKAGAVATVEFASTLSEGK